MVRAWVAVLGFMAMVAGVSSAGEACDEVRRVAQASHPAVIAGTVEITGCARIAGFGAELMVRGTDDPVAAFVGPEGEHIRVVVEALGGERIDVVPHSDDPATVAVYALSPVRVERVILYETSRDMDLVVADEDVLKARGENDQHLQLAAELTGWTIHLYSLTKHDQMRRQWRAAQERVPGITPARADALEHAGYWTPADLAEALPSELAPILGLTELEAAKIRLAAGRVETSTGGDDGE